MSFDALLHPCRQCQPPSSVKIVVHTFPKVLEEVFFLGGGGGFLALHVQQLKGIPVRITKPLYMFLTVKFFFLKRVKFLLAVHMNESLCSLRIILRILPNGPNQLSRFSPTKALLKEN
jgi:hypothetical protein